MPCLVCEKENFSLLLKKGDLTLVKCSNCGLVQVDNPLATFDIEYYNYYHNYYQDIADLREEEIYNPIDAKRHIDLLNRLECYRKNNALLDIGCGIGHLLYVAKKMNWQAKGIDRAPYAVDICKKFNINAECSDLLNLDLEDGYYDAITMFEVLEHLTHPKEYLLKVYDVLRKGGIFIMTTPNFNCLTRVLLQKRWSCIDEEHLFYFNPKTISLLLKKCNFRIIDFRVKNITLPELYRLFKDKVNVFRPHQIIRKVVEENKFLFYLKDYTNKILNLTGLGESIECFCQKI
ncbi:MAG: class I SAM-dependent methyltransferase [Candidatus Omnitrophica bacterium]|nr:class I SAM-dependent methyltransferase [Candidatus Omnitrophota bacterium]